ATLVRASNDGAIASLISFQCSTMTAFMRARENASEQWYCWIARRRTISASAENLGRRKHPAEILALSPELRLPPSQLTNSLQGQNSAGFPQICAIFQGIICVDISEFESYMPSHAVRSLWPMSGLQKSA